MDPLIEKLSPDLIEISIFCRFDGVAPEPRKGIRSGHVPGSKCIPFPQVKDYFLLSGNVAGGFVLSAL